MKLGLIVGYWPSSGPPVDAIDQITAAEDLGFDSIWTSEAYGSDCFTPLAWWGSQTERVKLGTAITQISARTPASTAMTAITLDHLSGGRLILGLGVSGPQVVEGWYGQDYAKPLARTREYVAILRDVWRREGPVTADGPHYPLPLPDGTGLGKPLKSSIHPLRSDIPIYLAAEGPKNIALGAEICDGWIPLYYSPYRPEVYRASLAARRPGFEVFYPVRFSITDDVEKGLAELKSGLAFYVGGMGAKNRNFHRELMARMGYEEASLRVQDLFLAGRRDEAVAAVPDAFVDEIALVGPPDRIRDRLAAWRASDVTTLLVAARSAGELRQAADLVLS